MSTNGRDALAANTREDKPLKLPADLFQHMNGKLVVRANELYHDGERAMYDSRHAGWQHAESSFFGALSAPYLTGNGSICCLDYGSGTGFVPLAIGPRLKPDDTLICVDLSQELLDTCRSAIATAAFPFRVRCLKTDGVRIPVDDESVDVVTVNSVLHHLHDLRPFADECRRILRDGGILVVAHEPNGDRQLPPLGKVLFAVGTVLMRPSALVYWLVGRSAHLERALRGLLSRFSGNWKRRNDMLRDIALRLCEEKLVHRELRGVEVQQLVDYQTQFGFSRERLLGHVFQGFSLKEWRSYNPLGGMDGKRFLSRSISRFMASQWPLAGCSLAFVLCKGQGCLPSGGAMK